jgi:hypothetical protein
MASSDASAPPAGPLPMIPMVLTPGLIVFRKMVQAAEINGGISAFFRPSSQS